MTATQPQMEPEVSPAPDFGRPGPAEGRPRPEDFLVQEAVDLIRERSDLEPSVAVVLGSGLAGAVTGDLHVDQEFSYEGLPGFPAPSVPGHPGRLLLGSLYGRPAAAFLGRVHLYEGHGIGATTLIPRLADALGAGALVLTNSAGGLNPAMTPGRLMLITDHLNFMGVNPLLGWRHSSGSPVFTDLSRTYDPRLRGWAEAAARASDVNLLNGVYAAFSGPSYETAAEAEFARRAGADAVGMSTVPEAAAAAALGLPVLAIACIVNAAGAALTHEEVLAAAAGAAVDLRAVLRGVVERLPAP